MKTKCLQASSLCTEGCLKFYSDNFFFSFDLFSSNFKIRIKITVWWWGTPLSRIYTLVSSPPLSSQQASRAAREANNISSTCCAIYLLVSRRQANRIGAYVAKNGLVLIMGS